MKDDFKKEVINYFVDEYIKGRMLNFCIMCNRKIKFEFFLKKVMVFGMDYIVIGYYVIIEYDKSLCRYFLKRLKVREKD